MRALAGDSTMTSLRPEAMLFTVSVSVPHVQRIRRCVDVVTRTTVAPGPSFRANSAVSGLLLQAQRRGRGGPHDGPVGLDAGPVPHGQRALPDEHPQAVEGACAALLGGPQEGRARR